MAAPTKVLDETRFESRARIGDIVALGLLVVVGGALLFEMYSLGYSAGESKLGATGATVVERDQGFVMMIIMTAIVVGSVGWIVYRLFSGSTRRVGG